MDEKQKSSNQETVRVGSGHGRFPQEGLKPTAGEGLISVTVTSREGLTSSEREGPILCEQEGPDPCEHAFQAAGFLASRNASVLQHRRGRQYIVSNFAKKKFSISCDVTPICQSERSRGIDNVTRKHVVKIGITHGVTVPPALGDHSSSLPAG